MNQRTAGFTLIEALISATVIALIGLVIVGLLSRTFQSNTKTQLLGSIKRNGSAALNYIDQTVRGADAVVCVGSSGTPPADNAVTGGNTIILGYKDPSTLNTNYTRIRVTNLVASGVGKTNGSIQMDHPVVSDTNLAPGLCNTALVSPQNLIDTDLSSGVAVKLPSTATNFFSVSRKSGSSDSVMINFSLTQSVNAGTRSEETLVDTDGQIFQTTIQVRK